MMTLLFAAVRAAMVLAAALVAVRLLARSSAATRRNVLATAFAVVLVMPLATALLPALHLRGADSTPRSVLVDSSAGTPLEGVVASASSRSASGAVIPTGEAATTGSGAPLSPLELVLAFWALGAAAVLGRFALGVVRARRLVARARFVETLEVDGDAVEVRISEEIETPAVTGMLRPVVLLPAEATAWSTERRRLVLAHELAHIASRDCLTNAVAQLAVAAHWFNPLAWLAARRLRIERELAADDRVLDGGASASSYAEHLLALATARHAMPAGALAMAEPSQISTRIRAVLVPHTRTPLGRARFLLGGAALALAAFVACATPERDVAPSSSPQTAKPAENGIQSIVEEEIERMYAEWGPCAAIVLVLDPQTGQVVAAAHRGGTETSARDAAVRPIVPGSTVKPLVIAAALDDGVIAPADRFDTSPLPFTSGLPANVDQTPHGTLDVAGILAVSSNVGLVKIFDKMGPNKGTAWMKRFHLAAAPTSAGRDGAAYSIGARLSSNPLEIAAAFSALAAGGVYHAPTFAPSGDAGERIVRADTAATVLAMLEGVTAEGGTGTAARVAGVRVAGKTGTIHLGPEDGNGGNDTYASFVGTAPLENPRYVIFVGAETPREGSYGGKVAAPVFSRIMTRLLAR